MLIAAWGPEKSGKSKIALSKPQPIYCADFDLGLEGALEHYSGIKIEAPKYPLPIVLNLGVGIILNVRELWEKYVLEFVSVLEDKKLYQNKEPFKSIVVASTTQMQRTVRRAILQMKQEAQLTRWSSGKKRADEELRSSLLQIEYGEPNAKMQTIIYAPKQYGKHMFLTHYETEEYKDQLVKDEVKSMATGKMVMEGFKDTVGLVDLVLLTSTKKNNGKIEFYATITHSRLHAGLTDMTLRDPTYDSIIEALNMLRGE